MGKIGREYWTSHQLNGIFVLANYIVISQLATYFVVSNGFEPLLLEYQSSVLTILLTDNLVDATGFEPVIAKV